MWNTCWTQKEDNAAGMSQGIRVTAHHECVIYHMSLLVLFRARQWLSAAEQVPVLAQSAATPNTLGQLRRALEDPLVAPHLPFAADFEDEAGYGPIVSRLLFYAEMSATSVRSMHSLKHRTYRIIITRFLIRARMSRRDAPRGWLRCKGCTLHDCCQAVVDSVHQAPRDGKERS